MDIDATSERMQCVRIGDVTIIRLFYRVLIGHIVVHQLCEQMGRILDEHAPANVVVNLARVEMMSSTMIGKLIKFNNDIAKRGGRFVLTNVHTEVQGVFAVARINHLFTVKDDEADALASF